MENMDRFWTTQDGKNIAYKDIEDNHLLNIINFIQRKSVKGVIGTKKIYFDSGYNGDSYIPDFIRVEEKFFGDEVKKALNFEELKKEANKRGLLTLPKITSNSMEKEIKKGQIWKSKLGGFKIEITHKLTGNRHWMTKKLSKSPKNHKVHEGTLLKFYELTQDNK